MSGLRMRRQCLLVCRSGKDDTGGNRCQNYSRNAFSRKLLDSEHIGPHFSGSDLPGFQFLPAIITFSAGGKSISIALRKRPPIPQTHRGIGGGSVLNAHTDSGVTPGRMSLRTMATGPGLQTCWDRKNRTGCNELRENAIVSPKRATIDEKMESSGRSTRSPSRRSYLL